MKPNASKIVFAVAVAMVMTAPGSASALQRGTQAQQSENVRATAKLRSRIEASEVRIAAAQRSRVVTPERAATLRRKVGEVRIGMTRLSRRQGFVSAAELASYNRELSGIDVILNDRGVPRSSGSHMTNGTNGGPQTEERRFDCQNDPIPIAIPGDKLEDALEQLSRTTRCPISGTGLAQGKRSKPVVGTMTPMHALQAMLDGTGLQVQQIRQGFQVIRLPRR